MAVMDEFKEEREALKNGTPKQKLAYFWYYYKWHVIIALVVIIMIVSFVKQLTDRKDPAFYAVMLNASLLDQMTSEQPDFVTDFAEKEGKYTSEAYVFGLSNKVENTLCMEVVTNSQKYYPEVDLSSVLTDFTADGIVFEIVIDLNAGVDPVVTIAGWRDLDWGEIQPVL